MKNQYFGDINDYRKYHLLRLLTGEGGLTLGICWMLTQDDGRTDGKFIQYLKTPETRRTYDPPLYDFLQQTLLIEKTRAVQAIQSSSIITATWWDRLLLDDSTARKIYFADMYQAFTGQDLLFFDPDNGIEVKSRPPGKKDSSKYIYWHELRSAWFKNFSLLVYQHFPRVNRRDFLERMVCQIKEKLPGSVIECFQTSYMVYFLVVQPRHQEEIKNCIHRINQAWNL
ncbi:MAG: hypothetical protein CVU39_28175 [Chloroflexi bacterium HGW-Chloroflexi-10]|nr:MAG: hypothetical protein CVU39_28175 [Chloroflexi bacterium HGW-Chloroflexi-10]